MCSLEERSQTCAQSHGLGSLIRVNNVEMSSSATAVNNDETIR